MIVQRTSVFPAGQDAVFQKLKQLGTLQTIAAPYASFEPLGDGVCTWEVGSTSTYRFRLFGCIPFGTHTIHIVRFDPDGIRSREGNEHILHPEKDIFIKEDQQKLTALLADVGAETKIMRGGHLAFVSSPELYIGAIRGFLNRLQLRKDDDNR